MITSLPVHADPDTPAPLVSQQAQEVRPTDEKVILPIVMVGEYPFIEASIAVIAGKLMLDTGYHGALMANYLRVPATSGRPSASASIGITKVDHTTLGHGPSSSSGHV